MRALFLCVVNQYFSPYFCASRLECVITENQTVSKVNANFLLTGDKQTLSKVRKKTSLSNISIGITADKASLELINTHFYIRLEAITESTLFLHPKHKAVD